VDPAHVHKLEVHRKNRERNTEIVRNELAYEGLSVIITARECVVTARK
jgi:indolepyruvate ferredoxin oxidoreductase alpha subunit